MSRIRVNDETKASTIQTVIDFLNRCSQDDIIDISNKTMTCKYIRGGLSDNVIQYISVDKDVLDLRIELQLKETITGTSLRL